MWYVDMYDKPFSVFTNIKFIIAAFNNWTSYKAISVSCVFTEEACIKGITLRCNPFSRSATSDSLLFFSIEATV